MNYVIVTGIDVVELEGEVNQRISEGFICQGGVFINSKGILLQAMTKKPDVAISVI